LKRSAIGLGNGFRIDSVGNGFAVASAEFPAFEHGAKLKTVIVRQFHFIDVSISD
jgi:hypothetical protein